MDLDWKLKQDGLDGREQIELGRAARERGCCVQRLPDGTEAIAGDGDCARLDVMVMAQLPEGVHDSKEAAQFRPARALVFTVARYHAIPEDTVLGISVALQDECGCAGGILEGSIAHRNG